MRPSIEKKLRETLFKMSELWLTSNEEEKKIVKQKFEGFMDNVINAYEDYKRYCLMGIESVKEVENA